MRVLALDLGADWRGGQRQTFLVCKEFREKRVDVCLGALAGSPLFMEASRVSGLKVHAVRQGSETSPAVILDVAGLVRRFHPDVIWAGESRSHGACVWGRSHRLAPLAVHRRVVFPPRQNLLSRLKYNCVSRFLAVSRSVAEVLVQNGIPEGRVRVVPDGLPPDAFVEREMPAFPPYRLVHAGAFDGRKGQGLAVEVLAGLTGRGRDVTLTLLGEGPERAPIEALARKLGVANRCFFKGLVDNVAQEFAAAHLLLLPSDSEGAPLVLAEAMAAGCPSVAHDIGGVREVLCDGRAGLLIPGLRTRDWEEAVASLLDSATERTHLVDAGRKAASERTIETTAEILLYEFRKLSERIEAEP